MNNLLIDDYPLVVLPNLAKRIGLNEAILLQQMHFWIQKRKNIIDDISWVYNTYAGWAEQFPFWSESTIKRTVRSLENQNLLLVGNFNKLKIDNTKWYSINYQELKRMTRPSGQIDLTDGSKWTGPSGQNEQTITIDYPETTTETNKIPYVEIVNYLNDVSGKNYRSSTRKTKDLIKARWNEGFGLDDFKKVIDIKNEEWKNDQKMNKFIRPETLFSPKFEGYLNQETKRVPSDSQFEDLF
ncbi:conserved phage C-terminal domain-containing protein [Oceanobacillus indicireducens]|uniref:Phage conserved hypothetical protein C-terminal domain-containing protein n=1 Tax=Oceanobacillus indicireducens TaxID=1004261 RepID=A0A917Y589_9BACI|nr:conserved phage C-terminal domain-containing protein [Oceanobacillus indicireducens]GGN66371.1 hypothetical protein GCM10007971_36250 [Oceanobacillus indicireducens]